MKEKNQSPFSDKGPASIRCGSEFLGARGLHSRVTQVANVAGLYK